MIEVFYVGDAFYHRSGTMMSSIYLAGSKSRYDWGFMQRDLSDGKEVHIRQATDEELAWATRKLMASKEN